MEAQEVEDRRLQQLHQAVYLHQHLHPHRQLRIARRQLVRMPICLHMTAFPYESDMTPLTSALGMHLAFCPPIAGHASLILLQARPDFKDRALLD